VQAPPGHQEFLALLLEIEKSMTSELDLHLIVDNYATQNIPRAWHAWPSGHVFISTSPQLMLHRRTRLNCASPSLLNEPFFGSFPSVKQLIARIKQFVAAFNKNKVHSPGRPRWIQSWKRFRDFAGASLLGRQTRSLSHFPADKTSPFPTPCWSSGRCSQPRV
jgi:hypothetical protein